MQDGLAIVCVGAGADALVAARAFVEVDDEKVLRLEKFLFEET
jgi:hypothetical protein